MSLPQNSPEKSDGTRLFRRAPSLESQTCSVVGRLKVVLADAAERTMPVRRQVFERHIVVLRRIVDPAADLAHVLCLVHIIPSFLFRPSTGHAGCSIRKRTSPCHTARAQKSLVSFDALYYTLFRFRCMLEMQRKLGKFQQTRLTLLLRHFCALCHNNAAEYAILSLSHI